MKTQAERFHFTRYFQGRQVQIEANEGLTECKVLARPSNLTNAGAIKVIRAGIETGDTTKTRFRLQPLAKMPGDTGPEMEVLQAVTMRRKGDGWQLLSIADRGAPRARSEQSA
jgi:NOL1/NOP2/fmu family ribosome biogenesis protein